MPHSITQSEPIFTSPKGVNFYELTPTDFIENKDGKFYYAKFIIWQNLNMGSNVADTKEKLKEIINISNLSIPAQEKVNKIATLSYELLITHHLSLSKSLVLQSCSHFFYLDQHNPKEYDGEEVINAIIAEPEAYDFFLSRLEPLLAHCLDISPKDIAKSIRKTEKTLDEISKRLKTPL